MPRRNVSKGKAQQPKQPRISRTRQSGKDPTPTQNQRAKCQHENLIPFGDDRRYSYCLNCGKRFATEAVAPRARVRYTRTRTAEPAQQQLAMFPEEPPVDMTPAYQLLWNVTLTPEGEGPDDGE